MSDELKPEPTPEPSVLKRDDEESLLHKLAEFFAESTRDGLFPLVAYSLNQDSVLILTSSIPDLTYAIRILGVVSRSGYNLGFSLRPDFVTRIADENPHVFKKYERQIPRIGEIEIRRVGRVVATFGAPFYEQKGFALLDICGFSRLDSANQLAQLYSLSNAVDSAIQRSYKVCQRLRLPNRFGRTSTGDGLYLWHDLLGGGADIATFYLLVCIMTQAEAMRIDGFPMRLKAAFVIGSAFMFYEANARMDSYAVASNAVGAATNNAARLVTAAKPSQVLVGDFVRSGEAGEKMDPTSMLQQVNQLFREEGLGAATLELKPKTRLRTEDKHGDTHYCWNAVGVVPNQIAQQSSRVTIGLEPDDAAPLAESKFVQS